MPNSATPSSTSSEFIYSRTSEFICDCGDSIDSSIDYDIQELSVQSGFTTSSSCKDISPPFDLVSPPLPIQQAHSMTTTNSITHDMYKSIKLLQFWTSQYELAGSQHTNVLASGPNGVAASSPPTRSDASAALLSPTLSTRAGFKRGRHEDTAQADPVEFDCWLQHQLAHQRLAASMLRASAWLSSRRISVWSGGIWLRAVLKNGKLDKLEPVSPGELSEQPPRCLLLHVPWVVRQGLGRVSPTVAAMADGTPARKPRAHRSKRPAPTAWYGQRFARLRIPMPLLELAGVEDIPAPAFKPEYCWQVNFPGSSRSFRSAVHASRWADVLYVSSAWGTRHQLQLCCTPTRTLVQVLGARLTEALKGGWAPPMSWRHVVKASDTLAS